MKKINSSPLEIEEVFLDSLVKKREEEAEIAARKIESPLRKRKFYIFSVCGTILLFFLLVLSFNLQILNQEKYKALALNNKFLNLKISAERGIIYDKNMTPLVSNEARFDLWFDRSEAGEKADEVLKQISEILNIPIEELQSKIKAFSSESQKDERINSFLIAENLSRRELILIEAKLNDFEGVKIKKQIKRNYLKEESLSHILGYLGKISSQELKTLDGDYEIEDYVGKEGLEKSYEKILAEKKGILEIERDAKGRIISKKVKENPCSGNNLVLSLDFPLQKMIAQTLRKVFENEEVTGAAAVALDPRSGEILSLVSIPSFNNNLFSQGISQEDLEKLNRDPRNPQLNRAIGGVYPVGSTIKPLIAAAALEEGIITEKTSIFAPLELCLENIYSGELECYEDWKFHGETDVKRAIAESVNPFFYIIGGGYKAPRNADPRLPRKFEGLGVTKIKRWLQFFGWGQKTGIDLPGEVAGRVPDPEWKEKYFSDYPRAYQLWYRGDTYNLSIGQGYILITPIQVAVAFQAIANGMGKIFKPKIVKEILYSNEGCSQNSGSIIKKEEIQSELLREVPLKKETIRIVKEGMREAVASPAGSAAMLSSLPVKVAAKTGTAQTSIKNVFHNWITVFGPYENPEILLTIIIENVKGTRIVAQKAAKEILEWYFTNERPQDYKDKEQ